MFVELHMLQNFVPSNLNRDDTGAPKDCQFGGHRRARISSQCLKRATRLQFSRGELLPDEDLAVRTRRLVMDELVPRLERAGRDADDAHGVVELMLSSVGIALKRSNTQYLLFLGQREINKLEQVCLEHWDELLLAASGEKAKDKKGAKKALESVGKEVRTALDGGRAADLALFGRMLADVPNRNVDAASQVAHAISTHRVEAEFDYYTAVDDLQEREQEADPGAGMIGTVEFNSACYYRYANVDLEQLQENLQGDRELAFATLRAFMRASIEAVPTGKQNSMAAHNPPSLICVVVRDRRPQNLANAFVRPVRGTVGDGMIAESVKELGAYRGRLARMYGTATELGCWVVTTEENADGLGDRLESVDELLDRVVATAGAGVR